MLPIEPTLKGALGEIAKIAERCPGFGMCRTDFLHTGVCPPGKKYQYASFFPQGRMQVITALERGEIPITETVYTLATSCTECGVCDKQCYFISELQPLKAFVLFKELMQGYTGPFYPVAADENVKAFAAIVGEPWVSNDPAIRAGYARVRSPLLAPRYAGYVVLPESTEQVAEVVQACNRQGLPYAVRGSGTSFSGALTDGVVIDLCRMDDIEIQAKKSYAVIGPGVTAFALQKAAMKHNLRAPVAEPAACVCANIISTNMHSLFSYGYGLGIDHCIDAEFVGSDGTVFTLSNPVSPRSIMYAKRSVRRSNDICTRMSIKLHPVNPNEEAVLIPFGSYEDAIRTTRTLALRRICTAIGVLGTAYMSMFLAPTSDSERNIRRLLETDMGIQVFLLAIGDKVALETLRQTVQPVLGKEILPDLMKGLPMLENNQGYQILTEYERGEGCYHKLFADDMRPLLAMALRTGSGSVADLVAPELKGFYEKLVSRAHMSNPVWLNTFRIVSARMGRGRQFVSRILWLNLDNDTAVDEICRRLASPGEQYALPHSFGYLVPLDQGKHAVMEYDYYYDSNDPVQKEAIIAIMAETTNIIRALRDEGIIVCSGEDISEQGCTRPEGYLYGETIT